MVLSCCIWALSGDSKTVLSQVADIGFEWIDIRPFDLTGLADCKALNLQVSCVGASFGMPDGIALDSVDSGDRERALNYTRKALEQAAELGATAAYVVPGMDDGQETLDRYADSLAAAADRAMELGMTLGIEHFPGKALPTATGTLAYLEKIGHENLYLLLDIGHLQMSGEDPAGIINLAKSRLSYVHLDDNDGENDLHWSLTEGVQTEAALQAVIDTLGDIGYSGAMSLELSPKLDDPGAALRESKAIVDRLM